MNLQRVVAVVAGQQVGDHRVEQGDLGVQAGDQGAQRGDLARVRLRQGQAIEPGVAPHPENVRAGDRDAQLGQHRVHLVLVTGAASGPPIVVDGVDNPSMNLGSPYGEREAPLLHRISGVPETVQREETSAS